MELVDLISTLRDRDSTPKSRILLNAVSGEGWYLPTESKLIYPYDFAAVIDLLHVSVHTL